MRSAGRYGKCSAATRHRNVPRGTFSVQHRSTDVPVPPSHLMRSLRKYEKASRALLSARKACDYAAITREQRRTPHIAQHQMRCDRRQGSTPNTKPDKLYARAAQLRCRSSCVVTQANLAEAPGTIASAPAKTMTDTSQPQQGKAMFHVEHSRPRCSTDPHELAPTDCASADQVLAYVKTDSLHRYQRRTVSCNRQAPPPFLRLCM